MKPDAFDRSHPAETGSTGSTIAPSPPPALFSIFAGLVCLACAYLIAYTPSCAQVPAITADIVAEVQCVASQVESGTPDFESIAIACGGMAVTDVITIVTALASPTEGGAASELASKAKLVTHKGAK